MCLGPATAPSCKPRQSTGGAPAPFKIDHRLFGVSLSQAIYFDQFWASPRGPTKGPRTSFSRFCRLLGPSLPNIACGAPGNGLGDRFGRIWVRFYMTFQRFLVAFCAENFPPLFPSLLRPLDATTQGTVAVWPSGHWIPDMVPSYSRMSASQIRLISLMIKSVVDRGLYSSPYCS